MVCVLKSNLIIFLLQLDEAKQRHEKAPNSLTAEGKAGETYPHGLRAEADFVTERLDLGFPDEEEAIQLGLIVPESSECREKGVSKTSDPQDLNMSKNTTSNINKNQQIDSSELSVFALKNYTQIPEVVETVAANHDDNNLSKILPNIIKENNID